MYEWMKSQNSAEELLGLMTHRVFVRIGSPMTAKWAAEYCGTPIAIEDVEPDRSGPRDEPQRLLHEVKNFTADELRRLPLPSYGDNEIHCVVDFPNFTGRVRAPMARDVAPPPTRLVARPREQMILAPFAVRDLDRLGMPLNDTIRKTLES